MRMHRPGIAIIIALLLLLPPIPLLPAGAEKAGLAISLQPSTAKPGEPVNVTVTAPPYTLVTMVFRLDGEPVKVRVLKVYKGVVKTVGSMLLVVTGPGGEAVFTVEAPSRPGSYVVEASTLAGQAEAVLRVYAPSPLQWIASHRLLVAVLAAVLVAVLAYLYLTGAVALTAA